MPIGYLIHAVLWTALLLLTVRPPIPEHSSPYNLTFLATMMVNEVPHLVVPLLLIATTQTAVGGDLGHPVGLIGLALNLLCLLLAALVARRALRARPVLNEALGQLGPVAIPERQPWARIVLRPVPWRGRGTVRTAGISYGPAGRANTLDVYHTPGRTGGPMLLYFHGGGFRSGHKNREGKPLVHRLARKGWVTVSANYRLSPEARYPDHLIDVKRAIAWARSRGAEYGADPSRIYLAGGSAGGHLATAAALTADDPTFQPDFADADTSVAGVVSLYGFYGAPAAEPGFDSSIHGLLRSAAATGRQLPPFLVVHGDHDTSVVVTDARRFVDELREVSTGPVVYAELPAAQHAFDLLRTARSEAVVDAVEAFLAHTTDTGLRA